MPPQARSILAPQAQGGALGLEERHLEFEAAGARVASEATRGSAVKLAAESAGRGLGVVTSLLIVRGLGPDDFGVFAFLSGLALIGSELAELGLQATASRALVARSLTLRMLVVPKLAVTALVLALGAGLELIASRGGTLGRLGSGFSRPELLLPLLVYFVCAGWTELLGVALRAFGHRAREAAVIVSFRATALALVAAVFLSGGGLAGVAWAMALSPLPALLLAALLARGTEPPLAGEPEARGGLGVLRLALPLGVNGALSLLALRVEVFALAFFFDQRVVGTYAAPFKIVESLILVPAAICAGAMPALTREALAGGGPVRRRTAATAALLAVPAAIGLGLLAPGIVGLVFGADYAASALPLRLLAPALVAIFMNNVLLHSLLALGRSALLPRLTAARLLASVLLALVLVPRAGAAGGALGFLLSEVLLLLLAARACSRSGFGVPVAPSLARAACVSLPMGVGLAVLPGDPLPRMLAGAAIYGVSLLLAFRLAPELPGAGW